MQADLDRAVDGASDGATERLKSSHLETNSDDNLSDVDKDRKGTSFLNLTAKI